MSHSLEPVSLPSVEIAQSGRARVGSCLGVSIAATGSYVPSNVVTNEDLASLGCDSQWIVQRTGIVERRHADAHQATSDLAYEAATRCLAAASTQASDVDLVIVATITPDFLTPATASLLQQRLGCIAPAFDLSAACSGFMYALITGAQFVHSGASRNALIVGSEVMSRAVDKHDVRTFPLFGDGAGAVLLQPSPSLNQTDRPHGLVSFSLGSDGTHQPLHVPAGGSREPLTACSLQSGRQFLQMEGRTVFKWAVRTVALSIQDTLAAAGVTIDSVALVILHQANARILDAAVESCSIPREKVWINLDRYGNTSAASIPLALDEAHRSRRIRRGDLILMCGFGAGLSWGSALVRW